MSYRDIADIAQNGPLYRRLLACAYDEKIPDAQTWVVDNGWQLATQPGWADAWASARAAAGDDANQDIGSNESVITDAMILAAVQALVATQTPAGGGE